MITQTFRLVATVLYNIATLLGMTYNEVNILAYYLLIPLTWTVMLDKYIGLPLTTGALLYIWIGIRIGTWGHFREWCDWAFIRSVDFLNYFNHWGGNYVLNSVIICVVIPVLVYAGLAFMLIMKG